MHLQQKAENLPKDIFPGGPIKDFEAIGRLQLIMLLKEGLHPDSKVLDIGCGCLRCGYWLMHFLDPHCYYGIEPNQVMLEAGIKNLLEPGLLEIKRPTFDNNMNFDSTVFKEKFNFFIARSIWTHASKGQIQKMLGSFQRDAMDGGIFLTSYLRAGLFKHRDYRGDEWAGISHESDTPALVYHKFDWIQDECQKRGLSVRELKEGVYSKQIWLKITKV